MIHKELYFFYNSLNNIVKIGRSDNTEASLKTVRYISGIKEISVICKFENAGNLEPIFHRLFSEYRTIGEWFYYEGAVKSYIEHIKNKKALKPSDTDLSILAIAKDTSYPFSADLKTSFCKLKKNLQEKFNTIKEIYISEHIKITGKKPSNFNLFHLIEKKQTTIYHNNKLIPIWLHYDEKRYKSNLEYYGQEIF